MTFDYSNLTNTALAQVADKGRTVQIVYKTAGTYDPTLDAIDNDSEETVDVKAIVTNYNKRDVAAGLVETNDLQVMIAASGITKPKTGDKILTAKNSRLSPSRKSNPARWQCFINFRLGNNK